MSAFRGRRAMAAWQTAAARLPGRRILIVSAALLLTTAFIAWSAGLIWFAQEAGRDYGDDVDWTDAIVVLTGGSERLAAGLTLLEAGHADMLFVSGVHKDINVVDLLTLAPSASDELACCIVLGYAAGDTRGNALETAAWVRNEGIGSLRLVTANYHMPRSLLEFRHALPQADIVAYPVAPANVHLGDWWRWPGTASLLATEYLKYLVASTRLWLTPASPLLASS